MVQEINIHNETKEIVSSEATKTNVYIYINTKIIIKKSTILCKTIIILDTQTAFITLKPHG